MRPLGINVPTARVYVPGTNVVETTWKTPNGWIVVRDALTVGPPQRDDLVTPHTRPPADSDADHLLVRTVECLEGRVEVELVCEPAFDYGRTPAEWTLVEGGRHAADATGAGQTIRLHTDMALGIEANQVRARHHLDRGDRLFCALSCGHNLIGPTDVDDAVGRVETTVRTWRDWLGQARLPDHRWRDPIQRFALRSRASRSHRRARRSPPSRRRCRRPPAASATGITATAGCATRRSHSKRCTGSTWTGRPRSSSSLSPTSNRTTTVGCRSCTASTAGATSPNRRATTSPATTAHAR